MKTLSPSIPLVDAPSLFLVSGLLDYFTDQFTHQKRQFKQFNHRNLTKFVNFILSLHAKFEYDEYE